MKKNKKSLPKRKKSTPKNKSSKVKLAKNISNKAGITPLGDRVLVKPLLVEEHTTTAFGIIIPDTAAKEKPEQGTVVAVGPGKRTEAGTLVPVAVEVGSKVIFSKYGFEEVKVNGVEYYLISESNILGILN